MLNFLIIFCAKYLYFLLIGIYLVYFIRLPKDEQKSLFLLTVIALPAIFLVSRIPALLYFDPRPFVVGHFAPLIPHAPDNGFPSDHALLTSSIASVVYYHSKKVSALLWLLTLMIGTARVLAGVHHWIDIFGAIIISVIGTVIVKSLLTHYKYKLTKSVLFKDL
jgi:undecaprenyl-diphosphatase